MNTLSIIKVSFVTVVFDDRVTVTDGKTDQPTDIAGYRVAYTRLKSALSGLSHENRKISRKINKFLDNQMRMKKSLCDLHYWIRFLH